MKKYFSLISQGNHLQAHEELNALVDNGSLSGELINECVGLVDCSLLKKISLSRLITNDLKTSLENFVTSIEIINDPDRSNESLRQIEKNYDQQLCLPTIQLSLVESQRFESNFTHLALEAVKRLIIRREIPIASLLQFCCKWGLPPPRSLIEESERLIFSKNQQSSAVLSAMIFAINANLIAEGRVDEILKDPRILEDFDRFRDCYSSDQPVVPNFSHSILSDSVIIYSVVWGDSYIDAYFGCGLASLDKTGELDRLSAMVEVVVWVDTTSECAEKIHKQLESFSEGRRFRFVVSTDRLKSNMHARGRFSFAFFDHLRFCSAIGCATLPLAADAVYGSGISELLARCPRGGVAAMLNLRVVARRDSEVLNATTVSGALESNDNASLLRLGRNEFFHLVQRQLFGGIYPGNRHIVTGRLENLSHRSLLPIFIKPDENLLSLIRLMASPRYSGWIFDPLAQTVDHGLVGILESKDLAYVSETTDQGISLEGSANEGYRNILKGLEFFRYPPPSAIALKY